MVNPIKQLKAYNLEDSVLNSISRSLSRTRKGSSTDLRTPFLDELSDDEILALFKTEVVDGSVALEDKLMEMEESNRSKFGPRSIAKNWVERRSSVASYFNNGNWWSGDPQLLADNEVVGMHLQPVGLDIVKKRVLRSANSGLPFYVRKGDVIEETIAQLDDQLSQDYPCVLFTRTQEGGKTRTVWGYPFALVLYEQRWYVAYLNVAKQYPWRAALRGPEEVNLGIHRLLHYARSNGLNLVSIDFSSYDQSISPDLQRAAFNFIGQHFMQRSDVIDGLSYIQGQFTSIGLVTPDGVMLGRHGVPSGSTWTNEVDSVVQYLVAKRHFKYEEGESDEAFRLSQIQGDDGAYAVRNPESLYERFRSFGLEVNSDKSDISDYYMVYLQNYFSPGYTRNGIVSGVYPVYRALNRLVHLERWTDLKAVGISGRDFFAIRAVSILENCKHHPWFEKLVLFVAKHDRESLAFDSASIDMYIRAINDRSSHGILNQYSDNVRGIMRFDTVRLLSKL